MQEWETPQKMLREMAVEMPLETSLELLMQAALVMPQTALVMPQTALVTA
jgi:hypothetical protein